MAWWKRSDNEPPEEPPPSNGDESGGDGPMRVPASRELFEDWSDAMEPTLTGFIDFHVPTDVELDFSRESLASLEAFLLTQYGSGDDFLSPDAHRTFIDGAVRYVGETFLRHCGGGWRYDTRPEAPVSGRPFIEVDSDTPTPVSPFHLMVKAMNRRTGTFLTGIFDFQHQNATTRAQREGRPPVRTAPDGTVESESAPATADLAEFLDTMDTALAEWASEVAPPADRWDGTRDSFARLAKMVMDLIADVDRWEESENDPLVQGAIRYVGETLRRNAGGTWMYQPGDKDAYNPYVGRFFVAKGEGDDAISKVPEITLRNVIRRRDSAPLLTAFDQWVAD